MDTSLALRKNVIDNYGDMEKAALAMSKSGYFQDSSQQAQAIVKIMAGMEMGFGAFASMTGVHIIQGRPAVGANLMASAVKGSGKYNYRVAEMTDKICSIDFYEGKEKIGNSSFTAEDAKKAGTKNMDKFPKNMLFARAMSNGVRWFTPDVFSGSAVYTPEELGADVDQEGNVIAGSFVEPSPEPAPVVPAIVNPKMTMESAEAVLDSKGNTYGSHGAAELGFMHRAICKRLKENHMDEEETTLCMMKRDAIETILHYRGVK